MTLIAPGRPVKHSKLAFATYKDQHMQPRKLAFATSKHVEKFYYPSINDEKKKTAATSVSCYMEYSKSLDENATSR